MSFLFFGPCIIFGAVIGLLATAFWIWMLIDCLTNDRIQGTDRLVWALAIFFLHFLGALLYYLIGRERRV